MEQIKLLLDISKKGINGTVEIAVSVVLLVIIFKSLFIRFHKIISFNDFDRLLLPKNEKSIQRLIVLVIDYCTFSFLYLIFGTVNAIVFGEIINIFYDSWITNAINWVFNISLSILILTIFIRDKRWIQKLKNIKWSNKLLTYRNFWKPLDINYYSSFGVYTFICHFYIFYSLNQVQNNISLIISIFLVVFLLPMFLLYLYRSYNKKYNHEYICNFISEEEFNDSMLIIHYTLDKDRIIFRKPNDKESSEIFMYDRTSNKHYKFTRVSIILGNYAK